MRTAPLSPTTNRPFEKEPPPGRRRGYQQKLQTAAMLRPTTRTAGAGFGGGRGGDGGGGGGGEEASAGTFEPMMVHVFDLSMFGVGFSCRRALEVGEIYRFAMCDRRQAGSRVEIRSCRGRSDGMFDIGGQFC